MKRTLLFTVLIALSSFVYSQVDSVKMEDGFTKDVYYKLSDKSKTTIANDDWDIAFSTKSQTASIFVNEAKEIELFTYPKAVASLTNFNNISSIDTAGLSTWTNLYNSKTTWDGAFNQNRDKSDQFNYGWGQYNLSTNNVEPDSMYIMKFDDGTYKKILIDRLKATGIGVGTFEIRWANLDGTGLDSNKTDIKQPDYQNKKLIYYSLTNDSFDGDRDPDKDKWDLLFTGGYYEVAPGMIQNVPAVMFNNDVKVAKEAVGTDNSVYTNTDYSSSIFSIDISTIGFSFYSYPPSFSIKEYQIYFIQDADENIYRLYFTDWNNANNNIEFNSEKIGNLASSDISNNEIDCIIYPNPAKNNVNLIFNSNVQNKTLITIYDYTGKIVYSDEMKTKSNFNNYTINTSKLTKGLYFVNLKSGNKSVVKKLICK